MKVLPQDLMLGDWVRAIDGEMLTVPIQVEGITAESIMAGGKVYKADMLQGIALTAARLEKNGFVKKVQCGRTCYVIPETEQSEEVAIIEYDCHGMKTYWYVTDMLMLVRLTHLSDLQHALRMDGKIKEVRP